MAEQTAKRVVLALVLGLALVVSAGLFAAKK